MGFAPLARVRSQVRLLSGPPKPQVKMHLSSRSIRGVDSLNKSLTLETGISGSEALFMPSSEAWILSEGRRKSMTSPVERVRSAPADANNFGPTRSARRPQDSCWWNPWMMH